VQVEVVAEGRRNFRRVDNRQALDDGQGPRVPRQVREQRRLAEEDGGVALLGRPADLEAKQARVELVVDVLGPEMALGQEPQTKADAVRRVVAACYTAAVSLVGG